MFCPFPKPEEFKKIYQENITIEDIQYIERKTTLQSQCRAWHHIRIGRITSSNAHSVLRTDKENPSKSLKVSICMESKEINTPAIFWGGENEGKALEALIIELDKTHTNLSIGKVGLRLPLKFIFIGASADGKGKCDCHGEFLVETKCPYKYRH